MTPINPPLQAPTAAELLADPVVQSALAQAWTDSQAGDPSQRHEEGGWIYMNTATRALTTRRAPRGLRGELEVGNPHHVAGSVVVGVFHTHPNPTAEGWVAGPSPDDVEVHARLGVPGLIRADDGDYVTEPERRRGGLTGNAGFPA